MVLNATTKDVKKLSPALEQLCRCFSMSELSLATNNFDEKWCIGQGGSGKVYKGMISNGPTNIYAVKRLHFMSGQGAPEFWVEFETLSRLRHCNIVPLIGYCKEGKDMALVYEYMPNGSLYDHIKKGTVLTWSQWLKICLGAARGLDYLHTGTGTRQGVIHRDVKSSNILLDQNYDAKLADFGLAKLGPINQTHTHVRTAVKGSIGYMDPSYFYTGKLTRKSDVYSFGVVLLEVLCGKPALDESLDDGLAVWAQNLHKQGKLTQIIDSRLRNRISKSSLKEFSQIAVQCLVDHRKQRPTMTQVVGSLERALLFQERETYSCQGGITIKNVWSLFSLKDHFKPRSSVTPESKEITAISENVSIQVPAIVTEVEPEGQDDIQPKSNQVITPYVVSLIDMLSSPSTSGPSVTPKIKESIWISNRDDGCSGSSSLDRGIELGNKYMSDHVPSQEGENNRPDTRKEAYDSATIDDVEADQVEQYENGTRDITRVRLRRRRFSEHEADILWSENREKVYKRYNIYGRLPLSLPESKEIITISENVSIPVPAIVTEVEPEVKDDIKPKSNQVITPYIISIIDMLSSPSTSVAPEIKESIWISNRDDGCSGSSTSLNRGIELGNKYMSDHVPSQERENNRPDTRKEAYDSATTDDVKAERVEQYKAGVYINLLALPNGTNVLKRVRFRSSIFSEHKAERWWSENCDKVYKRYNICLPNLLCSGKK